VVQIIAELIQKQPASVMVTHDPRIHKNFAHVIQIKDGIYSKSSRRVFS
jgi:ABC-type lipoprotein export system ATPase subunit